MRARETKLETTYVPLRKIIGLAYATHTNAKLLLQLVTLLFQLVHTNRTSV